MKESASNALIPATANTQENSASYLMLVFFLSFKIRSKRDLNPILLSAYIETPNRDTIGLTSTQYYPVLTQ